MLRALPSDSPPSHDCLPPPCRYGKKLDAVDLLQEWVREIGSTAGLSGENTSINSGSIGSPESRLEVSFRFIFCHRRRCREPLSLFFFFFFFFSSFNLPY